MPIKIRDLAAIRSIQIDGHPQAGRDIARALQQIVVAHNAVESQTNSNSNGQRVAPPPPIDSVNVTGQNGHFNVAIQDNNNLYAGVEYHVAHADNPGFTNAHIESIGPTRNANLFLGNTSRYFMAYSSYGNSHPSPPRYHGGAQPTVVNGGGSVGPPAFQASEGSGTGQSGVAISGPGPIPYRSGNGKAPTRA